MFTNDPAPEYIEVYQATRTSDGEHAVMHMRSGAVMSTHALADDAKQQAARMNHDENNYRRAVLQQQRTEEEKKAHAAVVAGALKALDAGAYDPARCEGLPN